MNIFDELSSLYQEIDDYFSSKEFEARSKAHHRKELKWRRKRELNDHAYFLFIFTRLEDRIREESSKLIDNRQRNLSNWKQRRAWEILPKNKESSKIHFKQRVALLTEKGQSNYNRISEYYFLRNQIGHGGNFTTPVSIPNVVLDMKNLYAILKV